jgi:hypothetical protein
MKNLILAKKIASFITFPAVVSMVSGAVKTTVPQRNVADKLLVFYGSFAVSSLIAEATTVHIHKKIDEFIEWYFGSISPQTPKLG